MLLVVFYHAKVPGFTGGFLGVDVFFVLSGYLITRLLLRERDLSGTISFADFYARRARRILPAAILVTTGTSVAVGLLYAPVSQVLVQPTGLWTALFAGNVWLASHVGTYFGAVAVTNPYLQEWSLGVEEQFYFAWPMFIAIVMNAARSRRALFLAIGALLLSTLALAWLSPITNAPAVFFLTPYRAWEFAMGSLAVMLVQRESAHARSWVFASWAALVAVVASAALDNGVRVPLVALPATAGTAVLLMAGVAAPRRGAGRLLRAGLLTQVGRVSYSLYLVHWPALVIATAWHGSLSPRQRFICVAVSFLVAVLLEAKIERPIRFHRFLLDSPRRSLVLAGALTVTGVLATLAGVRRANHLANEPGQQPYLAAINQGSVVYGAGCLVRWEDPRLVTCEGGVAGSDTTIVLVGDSHAEQWRAAFGIVARQRHWRLVSMTRASCPLSRVRMVNWQLGRVDEACDAWRESAIAAIAAMHPAVAVIANSSGYIAEPFYSGGTAKLTFEQWHDGVFSVLQALDSARVATVLLRDTPNTGIDSPVCLSRATFRGQRSGKSCSSLRFYSVNPTAIRVEALLLQQFPRLRLMDMTDSFCGPVTCLPEAGGVVRYLDSGHASPLFLQTLAPGIGDELGRVLAGR
ncbi:MAG: acyltransferase 3 [Gemmatimonadetes bacterium]|nr:acyltransferase 3 [Gemmatimonadota bacterium]